MDITLQPRPFRHDQRLFGRHRDVAGVIRLHDAYGLAEFRIHKFGMAFGAVIALYLEAFRPLRQVRLPDLLLRLHFRASGIDVHPAFCRVGDIGTCRQRKGEHGHRPGTKGHSAAPGGIKHIVILHCRHCSNSTKTRC